MKKIMLLLFALFMCIPICVEASSIKDLSSEYALVHDLSSDEVIYEKGSNDNIDVTSLNKLMIALNIVENVRNIDYNVRITNDMFEEVPIDLSNYVLDEYVKYPDLIKSMLVENSDVAAYVLSVNFIGKLYSQINYMNQEAQRIGLKNTDFSDVIKSKTTLNDLLTFMKYALDNEKFNSYFSTIEFKNKSGLKIKSKLSDKDYVIGSYVNDNELIALLNIDEKEILVLLNDENGNALKDIESIYKSLKKVDIDYSKIATIGSYILIIITLVITAISWRKR